jgi:energy-coupling factor transporter transmembrane protein EcfT
MGTTFSPPPLSRGMATLLALYGAFCARSAPVLASGLLVTIATILCQGQIRPFAKFAGSVLLPVGLGLVLIWGFIRHGAPGQAAGISTDAGVFYALTTTLRLALLGAVFQTAVLSLPPARLVHMLQRFGVRGRSLAIVVSTLNLWPDFRRHVEQVYAARCARGLMPDRRLATRVRQLPYAIRTVFVTSLGQALERAESWEASGLVERLGQLGRRVSYVDNYSRTAGVGWLAMAVAWAVLASIRWP